MTKQVWHFHSPPPPPRLLLAVGERRFNRELEALRDIEPKIQYNPKLREAQGHE